jgi:hypothetical protein
MTTLATTARPVHNLLVIRNEADNLGAIWLMRKLFRRKQFGKWPRNRVAVRIQIRISRLPAQPRIDFFRGLRFEIAYLNVDRIRGIAGDFAPVDSDRKPKVDFNTEFLTANLR